MAGGSQSPTPHLFYLPIIFTSILGTWSQAITASLLSGILMSGYFMPLNVEAGIGSHNLLAVGYCELSPSSWLLSGPRQ